MNNLLADADLCVKCGLCLPHCPTYNKTQNENESPRGRIALIQAWAGGHLGTSKKLVEHIDNCLLCRSCEQACPAVVPYGRLINDFREQIKSERDSTLAVWLLTGYKLHWSARASGALLLAFGTTMTVALGIKAPLDYSVFAAAAAALLLGTSVPTTSNSPSR